ncbi:MAG: hypothetical protein ABIG95_06905 [Candidatus Woesearchaeota archaeon]
MKLSRLKGLAHDFAFNLSDEIWFGNLKNISSQIDRETINQKTKLDKIGFFKKRLPGSFNFKRINSIRLKSRTVTTHTISVTVDNKPFACTIRSSMY